MKKKFVSSLNRQSIIMSIVLAVAIFSVIIAVTFLELYLNPWIEKNPQEFGWWAILTNSTGIVMLYCKSKTLYFSIVSAVSVGFSIFIVWLSKR